MKYSSEKAIDFGNVYKVYVLTFPDNRKYIGMTRQPIKRRWKAHEYKSQAMKEAILTFGWDNVKKEVVAENLDLEQAGRLEVELIGKHKTLDRNFGFNTTKGGDTFNIHSEQFLNDLHNRMVGNKYCVGRKISAKHIKALHDGRTPESYKKATANRIGVPLSDEVKAKMSAKAKERWQDEEKRKFFLSRVSRDMTGEKNPMYGKTQSVETREKIRAKALGRKMSLETRRNMSEASANKRKVLQVDSDKNVINQFNTVKEAALFVGAASTNISFCCKNKHRTAKGYFWRYADDYC